MPSVTTITSYKPVGLVNRTAKASKSTQRAKLKSLALNMPKFREMVKNQKLESLQPMLKNNRCITDGYTYNSYGCHYENDGRSYSDYGCHSECDDCRGTF